jgi:hypothetical protein
MASNKPLASLGELCPTVSGWPHNSLPSLTGLNLSLKIRGKCRIGNDAIQGGAI